ncbi:MAG: hypothetical protein UV55_C0054G0008 [Candidatus Gottesmanbacteria bacterium GW2011_GWC1_43_10]|nr:MAG: hypothetical protein UV04_C0042G0009 [Candidatus Gottesmanbacteria bacterium GW2011_GWA2_42_16]KKS51576.1 MAG: hypothetical protein UV17_C0060G0018 [Candidatus Gottesmanbacteria bacterium GW2011_GWA1_42_26]KKS79971.1 MAG: hypothetical protein UV55_C0054G0008 [Candidatus Gottesmanbacteria bacterium GW2011_GWC1_43_10]OGG27183.1 MAG: hypothetical protein A3A59_01330 [Candidatus Gottesmanbacteria bacterium RIFCSPLOWO2_01_FULL_42_10]
MNSLISNPINTPLPFSVSYGIINIQHSVYKDLPDLISLLTKDNLDQRRLVAVSSEHYPSMGEKWIKEAWDKVLNKFQTHHLGNGEVLKQLSKQAKGILSFKPIPAKGTHIKDPFNMRPVEVVSIHALAREQIKNIIVAKRENKIIGMGRLLEVEGSVEIVSLLTKREWRGNGIASKIIDELLVRSFVRPIYSFQVPEMIPFYLKRYRKRGDVKVIPFSRLPTALQRDLFYMNIFWGPYTILRID